jgi:hypothetical protein
MRAVLALLLVSTLVAAYFAPAPADDGVAPSERTRAATARTARRPADVALPPQRTAGRALDVLLIRPRDAGEDEDRAAGLFASTAWTPPPPVQRAAPPPPEPVTATAPQAPPPPFRVLGRFVEGTQAGVFLQHNDQNLVVRVGDIIAEHYKVESIDAASVTLRYGPLNQEQTLQLGSPELKAGR